MTSNTPAEVPAHSANIYMLRTAQQRHIQLSAMADQKANIIIGASLIMVTIIIGQAARGGLSLPLWVLGIGATAACCTAIMAVLPNVKSPPPGNKQFNPLFFGAVEQLTFEEYAEIMAGHMQSPQSVYSLMLRDMHCEAKVLAGKKYRRLRRAYLLFLTTLLLTALSFFLEHVIL